MKKLSIILAAALLAVAVPGVLHADVTGISPALGALSGFNGQTLTWGVSLYNDDPTNWWAITGVTSDYSSTGTDGEIPGGPFFFTDLLSDYFFNNFFLNGTALAPGQDINVTSPGDPVDLASFVISPTADPGTVTGQLHISYDIFAGNPYADPNNPLDAIGSGVFDIDTSVTSLGPNPNSPVPEPSMTSILAFGLAVLSAAKARHRFHRVICFQRGDRD